ncbi:retroviral-like aspartic protease family protein [Bradyrhizobium tropiciagri]|uniref:retroviral-like aspartic protease family protein n=1 Tax=Bradyrhizobium tropiciagri TaxID=312253 RepID=UPI003D313BF0
MQRGGNAQGQANLGAAYERGDGGLVKDEREAVRLYRLAADHGNRFAQAALARLIGVRPAATQIVTELSAGDARVRMVSGNGTFYVPALINDTLKLNFVVDSGASDVSIPADVAQTLMRTGTINESDFTGSTNHRLADGSIVSSRTFIIRSLKVGDRTVTNVRASIARANAPLLLGQSFLNRFRSWSQDNVTHELVLQ